MPGIEEGSSEIKKKCIRKRPKESRYIINVSPQKRCSQFKPELTWNLICHAELKIKRVVHFPALRFGVPATVPARRPMKTRFISGFPKPDKI